MRKPWLLSLGIGFPFWGLWGHRYVRVRQPHRGAIRIAGFHVIWTSYRRRGDYG